VVKKEIFINYPYFNRQMEGLYALIPVFNELSSLENGQSTLERFCKEFSVLLNEGKFEGATFVDDGSTDKTGEYLQEYYQNNSLVTIMTQTDGNGLPLNSGKTKAMLTGIKDLLAKKAKYIFTFDGDMYNLSGNLVDYMTSMFDDNSSLGMVVASYHQEENICPTTYSGLRVLKAEDMKKLIGENNSGDQRYAKLLEYDKPEHGFCWELILNEMFTPDKVTAFNSFHRIFPINSRARGEGATPYEKILSSITIGEEKLGISQDPLFQFS
jgi:glycosyltransferase involved in cell wall biosynthesis